MNSPENAYCRLCANLKPNNKLINLQYDEKKLEETTKKLTRLNASADFSDGILPKTVCLVCLSNLDRAYEFIEAVEYAQGSLSSILIEQQIKKEIPDSDSDDDISCDYMKDEDITVKVESDVKSDNEDSEIRRQRKKANALGLDSIPLSQLKLNWSDYEWVCPFCETQFSSLDELRNHTMEYHKCCNPQRCTVCNIRKYRLDSFLIHIRRHKQYLKLSCHKCNYKFTSQQDANAHKSAHKTTEHVCPGCHTSFDNADELKVHCGIFYQVKRARTRPAMPVSDNLTCLVCKKTFKHKGSLSTHLLIHTERKRDHTCDKCGKCFLNKQNLAGHMILHDNVRPYQCEICKSAFKTPGQLRSHVGVHDNKKPFACDQCGRCFRLQKQLTSHSIIHTDALPYVCSYCNKGFRFKTILNQHIRQHTGIKPYSCKSCQRDFTNWPNYNKHMKRRHGMDMAKKKHTPDGVYPINPVTGEVIIHPETNKTIEWKKQIMSQRKIGRPKNKTDVNFKDDLVLESKESFEVTANQDEHEFEEKSTKKY